MTAPLPGGPFGAIVADPPWSFRVWSDKDKDRSAENHYPVMSLAEIKALPVADIAAPDCALFLWASDPMLPQAFEVMAAWGLKYKTVAFYWAKTDRPWHNTHSLPSIKFPVGLGYWTRANPEQCLLGTRGKPKRLSKSVRRLIVSPRREHSRKPDEAYERIESLCAGPYLDLFSRQSRPGWTAWGDECGRFQEAAE